MTDELFGSGRKPEFSDLQGILGRLGRRLGPVHNLACVVCVEDHSTQEVRGILRTHDGEMAVRFSEARLGALMDLVRVIEDRAKAGQALAFFATLDGVCRLRAADGRIELQVSRYDLGHFGSD